MEQIARNAGRRRATGHLATPDASFDLFFFPSFLSKRSCGHDFYSDRGSAHDHNRLSLGDKMATHSFFLVVFPNLEKISWKSSPLAVG